MQLFQSHMASPLGDLTVVTDAHGVLRVVDFADHPARLGRSLAATGSHRVTVSPAAPAAVRQTFERYFAGDLTALDGLAVAPAGNGFQRQVWAALRGIAVGGTVTYGRLAKALRRDDPRAAIEVGAANGANPIAIVVPCHRVIASDGGLKGYAWGLHRKRWLLEHERAIGPQTAALPGF